MWQIELTDRFDHEERYYQKKRPRELAAVYNNLDRYIAQLTASQRAACVQGGYLHNEGGGVVAIDQRGTKGADKIEETRLYVFADDIEKVVYLITIGNKQEQSSDIKISKQFVSENFPHRRK